MDHQTGSDHKVINLSLPSLGVGDGRLPDGSDGRDKTNLIQKEIVKQLLYRRKPSDTPASRYNRLDTFHWWPAFWRSTGVGAVVAALALLAKVPIRVRDSLPAKAWTWVNDHLWGNLAGTLQWLSLLVVFGLTVMVVLWTQRLLQQRLRVTELAAGPTKVTLSESSSSYFDEYLDEIVYFFQTSKTAVVIFEDLDRFKDPHIFETLRELNLLLNNAEQTGTAPIRFVYAIRDSIFEQLDVDAEGADPVEANRSAVDHGETRRLMSTNRTKFFDLVVPMVPFISHRTSRDLIRQELETIDSSKRPGNAVVDIVGAHLTDMRLIKNICNEYEVFRSRILTEGGLKELTADRLFASIVYKNLYLADYEKIRDGTSPLDTLYRAYRAWVSHQTAAARTAERTARTTLRRIDAIGSRSAQLGARLQAVLVARYASEVNTGNARMTTAGATYTWTQLTTVGFWHSYLRDRDDLTVYFPNMYGPEDVLSFGKVQTLMGRKLSPEEWTDEDRDEVNSAITAALTDQRTVAHASMTDALGEPDKLFNYQGEECSIAGVAQLLFKGADLVLELLRVGFIDENFTLYITQFPGQAISASAMNFIIKAVQPNVMDLEYHFGTNDDVDTDDIKAVLETEAGRLLGGQSVYNLQVFDYLLTSDPGRLDEPIRRLAANAATDHEFLDAYLTSGKAAASLVQRLSASWAGIFDYLIIGEDPEARGPDLLDAALAGVKPELTYTVNAGQRAAIVGALPNLATITTQQSAERASEIARTIEQMGLHVDDLAVVAEPLRGEVIARSLYPVTLANLRTIVGGSNDLPLDAIKDARGSDVYPYVLAHLPGYLNALDEAQQVPTIAENDHFPGVLVDVGNAKADALEEVARRADPECMLIELENLDAGLWPSVARAHRLELTATNVTAYVAEHGVDEPLSEWLTAAGAIEVDDVTRPLVSLGLKFLNAETLADEAKLSLVDSMGFGAGAISVASLETGAHSLLPALVQKGLVGDDADAYNSLGDDEWATKENLISVSAAFPTYMPSLALSTNDLFWIASSPVPDRVKGVLLNELEIFGARLGAKGAGALAEWAASKRMTPPAAAIVTMASKGAAGSALPILKLLGAQASTIDAESLKSALNALGSPYSQLTTPGWDRPKVQMSEGVGPVLARLQSAGIVSKFEENTKRHVFEVSKRHS